MNVKEAIEGRKSIRRFLPTSIEREKLLRVLKLSQRAASWKNAQGYKILVVEGERKNALSEKIIQAIHSGEKENPDFPFQSFYPNYIKKRMLELGAAYYGHLGVDRKDKEKRNELTLDNFKFFGAPTAIFFLMEEGMDYWPTLDLGILLGTLMIAAREEGLDTIAQASLAAFPDLIRNEFSIESKWKVAVGASIGYADPNSITNQFISPRIDLDEFVEFY